MNLGILGAGLTGSQHGVTLYLYAGIFLLACFAIIHYYLYLRLRDTGYSRHILKFLLVEIPVDYLRLRMKYGWSPWPVYLMWPALIAGIVLIVIGVFRL
jgi:hypothetical protein